MKSIAVLAAVVFLVGFVSQADGAELDIAATFSLNYLYGGENVRLDGIAAECCFKVMWINDHKDGHELKSVTPGLFSSGVLGKNGTWTHTFTRAGTYEYYSTLYPKSILKIYVYNSTTECSPIGCGGLGPTEVPTSQLLPEIKNEVLQLHVEQKSLNKQMNELDKIISTGTNRTNMSVAAQDAQKTFNELQERVQQINKRLFILSKNDPLCLTVDVKGDCVYSPAVIQQSFNGPSWLNKIFEWNKQGLLSDSETITILKYLIQNNIIAV